MSGNPFGRRTTVWLIAVAVASFVASMIFAVAGELIFDQRSVGANTFSYSALGHRGWVELLRSHDIPVVVSRDRTADRAGPTTLLVIAEPDSDVRDEEDQPLLEKMLDRVGPTLLVLPKRSGLRSRENPEWIGEVSLLSVSEPLDVLNEAVQGMVNRRHDRVDDFVDQLGQPVRVALEQPQLIRSDQLKPIISSRDGILVGEATVNGETLTVLSDPDILANHGLGKGQNGEVAVSLVERMREKDGTVMIDETIHGFVVKESLLLEMFRFPLVLVSGQAILLALFLFWCAALRFGSPRPLPPSIGSGKGVLIANTASLLRLTGRSYYSASRYFQMALLEVATRLRPPAGLEMEELRHWLQQASDRKGVEIDLEDLHTELSCLRQDARVPGSRVLAWARRIHTWRENMLYGPRFN